MSLFGDLPFMVSGDSADVWARQDEFGIDASVGVPPDAFSDTGQDWGLPPIAGTSCASAISTGCGRAPGAMAQLFTTATASIISSASIGRIVRPRGNGTGPGVFTPADEPAQMALGERVLSVFGVHGRRDRRRRSRHRPGFRPRVARAAAIPGYKVFRWERHWHSPGQPFQRSARVSRRCRSRRPGTHDTEPMAIWWEQAPAEERRAVLADTVDSRASERGRANAGDRVVGALVTRVRAALLESLFASGVEPADPADSGRLRLARSHQSARHRRRPELDLAPAVAGRSACQPKSRPQSWARQLRKWSEQHRTLNLLTGFAADLRPGVLERDRSIEHRRARVRIGIHAEVALPLELEPRADGRAAPASIPLCSRSGPSSDSELRSVNGSRPPSPGSSDLNRRS